MAKKNEISMQNRHHIIALHKIGRSNRSIGRELKIHCQTVNYIVKKFKSDGSLENKKRSGRPKKTTERFDKLIIRTSKRNRRLTAPEITAMVNETSTTSLSVTTVKRRLRAAGLNGRIAMKKPLLRPQNKKKRLAWAKKYQNWTINDWCKVLWSDESKFQVFGCNRRVFVRRSVEERASKNCIVPTVKHGGGSVMVWGCFAGVTVGELYKVEGIMNKEQYKTILEKCVIPTGNKILGNSFTFQHDNDPKHTAKICKEYLDSQEGCHVMEWPPQSPDLNPIELLWDELDRKVRASHYVL